jgi:hypothetical protein
LLIAVLLLGGCDNRSARSRKQVNQVAKFSTDVPDRDASRYLQQQKSRVLRNLSHRDAEGDTSILLGASLDGKRRLIIVWVFNVKCKEAHVYLVKDTGESIRAGYVELEAISLVQPYHVALNQYVSEHDMIKFDSLHLSCADDCGRWGMMNEVDLYNVISGGNSRRAGKGSEVIDFAGAVRQP